MELFRQLEFNPMLLQKQREQALAELDKLIKDRNLLDITLGKK